MELSKIKLILSLLTGGVPGVIKYLLKILNLQILGRIKDKETALMYLKDVQAVTAMASAVLANHSNQLNEKQKAAGDATVAALTELMKALEDFEVEETELDGIIAKINEAVDAWKTARQK